MKFRVNEGCNVLIVTEVVTPTDTGVPCPVLPIATLPPPLGTLMLKGFNEVLGLSEL